MVKDSKSVERCGVCRDRLPVETERCCGRCQRMVCRACSRTRGRSHESALCTECYGAPRPSGFRATLFWRSWQRLRAG